MKLRTIAALIVTAIVIAWVAVYSLGGFNPSSASDTSAPTSTSTTTVPQEQIDQQLIKALTITSVSVHCPDVVVANGGNTVASNGQTVVKPDVGALKGLPPRKWSDAISTPFAGSDTQKLLSQKEAAICMDPLDGSHVANYFANLVIGNVKVLALNPWLQPFAGDASKINATAAGYVPLLDKDPNSVTLDQQKAAVAQNIAWQAVAEKVNTLLTKFQLGEIGPEQSVLNYHLAVGGLVVGGLPAVELNPQQESLPALHLDLTVKDACVPLLRIGFNLGDKRLEQFAVPTCVPQPAQKETPPPEVKPPGKETPPTTVAPPTSSTVPESSTTTVPSCNEASGKCHPPTTVAPPPTTIPVPTTPTTTSDQDSGAGAPPRQDPITPPTTVAPGFTPPTTVAPPAQRVDY